MSQSSAGRADWRAEAYGRLTAVVDELDSFRAGLRSWVSELQSVSVVGSAERGQVVARCGGFGAVESLEIDEDFLADATVRQIEAAITAAIRAAEQQARDELVRRQSGLTIFGVSVGEGLAGRDITELLPPIPTPGARPGERHGGGSND